MEKSILKNISNNIRIERCLRELSLEDFSILTGIPLHYVELMDKNLYIPELEDIMFISEIFNISIDKLIYNKY